MARNIAVVSDFGYLVRTLLLYDSIRRSEPEGHVYFLAMDDQTFQVLKEAGQPNLTVVRLSEVEDGELKAARQGRNWIEWVWLFQPAFPLWLMENKGLDHVFWMDGDMWLFAGLGPMFDEIGGADTAVSPHRFPPRRKGSELNVSVYNGGATYFKASEKGLACCREWRRQCIEWDYWWSKPKPGPKLGQKGGTQGYLDDWPEKWGAHVVQHLGCNLAPWNQDDPSYKYELKGGHVHINGQPLIFYHFQDFHPSKGRLAGPRLGAFVLTHIYGPYLRAYNLKMNLWRPGTEARDAGRKAG